MRLILAFLAIAQVRLSRLDVARSDMLAAQADEALRLAESRMAVAYRLAGRAR